MSNPHLPPEILDYIVDFLHDNPGILRACSLASKSWIPRARKHLFAEVNLLTQTDLESWKKSFPDPSTSPAHFTTSLHVGCARVVTAADSEVGGWITGFAHTVRLNLETYEPYPRSYTLFPTPKRLPVSLVPFHGFFPAAESLRVDTINIPPSKIFDFVLSAPLLEDLTVSGSLVWPDDGDGSDGPLTFVQPSNPPMLSGSLELFLKEEMKPVVNRLLSIPSGIHFRKLTLEWHSEEDLPSIVAFVEGCSHTLESLKITCYLDGELAPTLVDLSKATKLKDVTFRIDSWSPDWVTTALRTITAKHRDLRQISIHAIFISTLITTGTDVGIRGVEKRITGMWLELDRVLAQFWESHSIPPKIMCYGLSWREGEINGRKLMGRLLPKATRGGTVNLLDTR